MKNIIIEPFEYFVEMYKFNHKLKIKDARKRSEALVASKPEILTKNKNYFYKVTDQDKDTAYYWISRKSRKKNFDLITPIIRKAYLKEQNLKKIILIINKTLKKYDAKRVDIHVIKLPDNAIRVFEKNGYEINTHQLVKELKKKDKKTNQSNTRLEKMTLSQFRSYSRFFLDDTEMLVKGMGMTTKEAKKSHQEVFRQLAPKGFNDKNNFFLNIIERKSQKRIGTLWLIRFNRNDQKFLFVANIIIDKKCRGQGFGESTMRNIDSFARKHKLEEIQLNVFEYNEPARKLYEKCGFHTLYRGMFKDF